jgi:predicted methyltransferase
MLALRCADALLRENAVKALLASIALGLVPIACTTQPEPATITARSPHIANAVASSRRPTEDRARDADRKPADMLALAGIAPGQRVGDFIPGGGYFTRIFAEAVGANGKVYALIPPPSPQRPDDAIRALAAEYENVAIVQQSFTALSLPEPLDVIFTAQNYHDLHLARLALDWAAVNRRLFSALKPGGVFVVVDHTAKAGADLSVADALHRIDPAIVRREVEAAGFVLDGGSTVLRNPADTLELPVFDPAIRGHTDQFVMRFRKPK